MICNQKLPGWVTLPNGDSFRADAITAVRPLDAEPISPTCKNGYPPRVAVETSNHNCSIIDCKNNPQRDEVAEGILTSIKCALIAVTK